MLKMNNKNLQKFSRFIFFGVYFCILIFSQHFHNHTDSVFNNQYSPQEDTHTSHQENEYHSEVETCISCHFLATGNAILPEELVFEQKFSPIYNGINAEIFSLYHYNNTKNQQSRAPPFLVG